MAKRDNDKSKFIKINPLYNSEESLISVAILNALEILDAKNNSLVKIPSRKELTKLLKVAKLDSIFKALDEVNNIRIRPVPCIEATSSIGIIYMNHPIVGRIPCLAYRDRDLTEFQFYLVNSGLGDDVVIITDEDFNSKLAISDNVQGYQIFLNTGDKSIIENEEVDCNSCDRLSFCDKENICLYDNKEIVNINMCCNKYIDCFKWQQIEGGDICQ